MAPKLPTFGPGAALAVAARAIRRCYAARVRYRGGMLLALVGIVLAETSAGAQPTRPPADESDWRGTGIVLKLLPPPSDLHATRPVIVIGTHGRTGLTRLVIGSVAERVVRIAPCPVLIVKPSAVREHVRAAA